MYKIILTLICISFRVSVYSQTDILTHYPFNTSSEGWVLENSATTESTISNGHLKLRNKTSESAFFKNRFTVDPQKDFYLEVKLKNVQGTKGSYGIYFSDYRKSENSKWYYFLLAPGGAFWICENSHKNTAYTYHKTGSLDKDIYSGPDNTLAIEKKGNITNFYINSKNVFQLSNHSFWGEYIGLSLFGNLSIDVDHLLIKQKHTGINLIGDTGVKYTKESLGAGVNSKYLELYPIISADEKTLYFAVENSEDSIQSDIWFTTKNTDGSWSKRKNIGSSLNTTGPDYVINVTPDNNTLIVANEYKMVNGVIKTYAGLSMSHKTSTGWSLPEKITIDNYYNHAARTSYCLSPNRKVLLLSIERDDSYGSNDLYVSFLQKSGTWTEPKNMGSVLNTYASDGTPTLAADGKTLYYSTSGKPGYGSNDIFITKRLDETWTNWSEPQNLGPDINSHSWDAYYSVPASGEYAYIVSDDNDLGFTDIFKIKIEKTAKPEPVVIIYGHTYNKATNKPIEADISYHDLITGEESGIAKSHLDGSYKIVLPYSKAYGFHAEKKNFVSESNNIDLTEIKEYKEIRQDLYLTPLEIGNTITLNNIFFERSKPELLPGSNSELDRLVVIMETNPLIKIEISGHTDNVGNPAKNIELSEQRVKTIKNYLIDKGISAKRISGKGYGGAKPIASNSTEETRKLNRRVEFTIVK